MNIELYESFSKAERSNILELINAFVNSELIRNGKGMENIHPLFAEAFLNRGKSVCSYSA